MKNVSLWTGLLVPISLTIPAAPALAQEGDEVAVLKARIAELEAREASANARLEALETQMARMAMVPVTPDDAITMRGRYVPTQARAMADDQALAMFQYEPHPARLAMVPQVADEVADDPVQKAPDPTEAVEDVTEQQQGRFGSSVGLDLALGYSHFDNARINLDGFLALDAIFLGRISIDQVTADIFTAEPTLRVGLGDRFFLDAAVPYLYRTSTFTSGGAGGDAAEAVEASVSDQGIGDASVGASYRLLRETARRPDLVVSGRVKIPTGRSPFGIDFVEVEGSEGNLQVPEALATGSGVWGASLGVSVLKTLDPMVVFGSATYFRNFATDMDDIDENPGDQPGRVEVGDAFQFGAGLAYALNDISSISMSYTQRIVERTTLTPEGFDPRTIVGSQANVGLVNLGATFSLSDRLSLVSTVGIGFTDDSPDMTVNIRLPYRF